MTKEASELLKLAMIEPPPAMLADIFNFYVSAYAHKILSLLQERRSSFKSSIFGSNSKQKIEVYVEKLAHFFLRYMTKMGARQVSLGQNQMTYQAPLNFAGWACPLGDAKQIEYYLTSRGFTNITCQLHFGATDNYSGLWVGQTRTLEVHVKIPKLETLEDFWQAANDFSIQENDIFETVEHELIHFVQLIGYLVKRLSDIIGLPTKSVKDNKSSYISTSTHRKEESLPHDLEDAEFYTNLMDAVNKFARQVSFIEPSLKQEYLKSYIGAHSADVKRFPIDIRPMIKPNRFFAALQRQNPQKWKLAVKRFVNYIQSHPNILL